MKSNKLILGILLALSPVFSFAQMPKLQLGIKAGVNLSKLNGDNWDGGYKTNLLGGVEAGFYGPHIGISAEAFFNQSSYVTGDNFHDIYHQYYNNVGDSLKQGTFRVSYMSIPVLFNFKLLNLLWVQVGPQFNGVVGVKDVNNIVHDAKDLFKGGDISGVAGVRLNLPFHLSVGARYVFGLTELNAQSVGDSWKQRNIQIHLTYNLL
ncbi:outer membrane beta-barrel protein [Taibaiella soli]|uniref:Outer membrane protein beta-barrel domain-containing protein n=1 Tax=Taibaiella soli TaxID=1649169 RepID=A0A2W2AAJ8_9BACT|nr:outer membrane beta-barrel protein [Taibaiella soli]PZF72415.1 hypothetical protein DN068_13765 [Taibaiella soli]